MKNFFAFMVLALVGAGSFTACSNDDDDETPIVASVTIISSSSRDSDRDSDRDTSSISFTYEGSRLVGMASKYSTATVQYKDNSIILIEKEKEYNGTDTIVYKLENGRVATSQSGRYHYKFGYTGNQIASMIETAGSSSLDTVLYTWSNGNIVKEAYNVEDYTEFVPTELDNNTNIDLSACSADLFDGSLGFLNAVGARSNKIVIVKGGTVSDVKKDEKGRLTGCVVTEPDDSYTYTTTYSITYK